MPNHAIEENVIPITQGSTYTDEVYLEQTPGGEPVNLTGASVRSQLRNLAGALVATFACTILDQVDPLTRGRIARVLTPELTRPLVPAEHINHNWGLEVTMGDGSVLPEIQGGAMITKEQVI